MKHIARFHIFQYHYRETLCGCPTDGHDALSGEVDLNTMRVRKRRQNVPYREPLECRRED